ncbi:MAG TPA: IgGFc-binding protein [Polyangia bacterium]|jgi:hypothetical protein
MLVGIFAGAAGCARVATPAGVSDAGAPDRSAPIDAPGVAGDSLPPPGIDTGQPPEPQSACEAARQLGNAVGCEFYAVAPATHKGIGVRDATCYAAMLANTGTVPVSIAVEYAGTTLDVTRMARTPRGSGAALAYDPLPGGQLPPGQMAVLSLSGGGSVPCPSPAGLGSDLPGAFASSTSVDGTGWGHAFHITTSAPVIAYDIFPFGGAVSAYSSATLLIPTSAWGLNYVAADGYPSDPVLPDENPWVAVAAAEDGTDITINPSAPIVGSASVVPAGKNQPQTYHLTKGQVLQLGQHDELSGSTIQSNKPVGVWGGSTCMYIPAGITACDGAHQQLVPVNQLGSEYAAVRYRDRTTGAPESVPWTLVGAVDGTTLTYQPAAPAGAPAMINRGQTIQFDAIDAFTVGSGSTDRPFYLAGHMTGCSTLAANTMAGDPETVSAVPPQRWLSSYLFITDPSYQTTNLVFVRRQQNQRFADVTLDCLGTVGGWTPIGGDGTYEFARVDLVTDGQRNGTCDNGVHTAKSDAPFGLTVWGWDFAVSYAYPAGMGVRAINNVVVQ